MRQGKAKRAPKAPKTTEFFIAIAYFSLSLPSGIFNMNRVSAVQDRPELLCSIQPLAPFFSPDFRRIDRSQTCRLAPPELFLESPSNGSFFPPKTSFKTKAAKPYS